MSKPVVFVIGASGNVGYPTVKYLSAKFSDEVEIRAGVRNPDKADKLKGLKGVAVVRAEMGHKDRLVDTFKGVDTLYILIPPTEDRVTLSVVTAEAAKVAGVKHLLVVSVVSAGKLDNLFGHQFGEIEASIVNLGLPYTFLRLPFFAENYLGYKSSIAEQSKIFLPVDPTKSYTGVTCEDAGLAGAVILSEPSKHSNKMYTIVSGTHTFDSVTRGLSDVLGRRITYIRVSYEDAKQALLSAGTPEWMIEGVFGYFKLVDDADPAATQSGDDLGDFERITGQQPTSLKAWLVASAELFK